MYLASPNNSCLARTAGVWETTGLEGAALVVVEGDRESGSWLQKLKFLKELLARPSFDLPNLDTLAAAAIYLSWISTGAVECIEGGGHYRCVFDARGLVFLSFFSLFFQAAA